MSEFIKSKFQKQVMQSVGEFNYEEPEFEGPPKKVVSFNLTPVEANQFYFEILNRMRDGLAKEDVAKAVVGLVQERLLEKQKEAYGTSGPKSPIFRRSE